MIDGKCHWYSVKTIKQGEQLFFSTAPAPAEDRKKSLLNELNIKCECSRCQDKPASPTQRQQLASDPFFCAIKLHVKSHPSFQLRSTQLVQPLKEACMAVLQNYGQMDWCEEIEFVRQCFCTFYQLAHKF